MLSKNFFRSGPKLSKFKTGESGIRIVAKIVDIYINIKNIILFIL